MLLMICRKGCISGMAHGVPLATMTKESCGSTGAFFLMWESPLRITSHASFAFTNLGLRRRMLGLRHRLRFRPVVSPGTYS